MSTIEQAPQIISATVSIQGPPGAITQAMVDLHSETLTAKNTAVASANNASLLAAVAITGSPKGIYETISALTAAYPTGNTSIYLVTGNVAEVDTLTVTGACATTGNIIVILNGISTTIALTTAMSTAALVATKIRNTSFSGWVTSGTGAIVTFTKTAVGACSAPVFSAGSTGSTATFTITTAGVAVDGNWYYWKGSAWTVGGVYQSTVTADNSVTDQKIVGLSLDKVTNTFIKTTDFAKWNDAGYDTISATEASLTYVRTRPDNSSGAVSNVIDLTNLSYSKVIIKFSISNLVGSGWTFFVFNKAGSYVQSLPTRFVTGENTYELTQTYLTDLGLQDGFRICFATSVLNAQFTMTNLTININGYQKSVVGIIDDIYNKINNPILSSAFGFPSRFDTAKFIEVLQTDASILLTRTDSTGSPGMVSLNVNTDNSCKVGKELWVQYESKSNVAGGNIYIYAYRGDNYNPATAGITIPLTTQYSKFKTKITINVDVPDGVAVYLMLRLDITVGNTIQFKSAQWSLNELIGDNSISEGIKNVVDNIGVLNEQFIGQMVNLGTTDYTEVSVMGSHLVTPDVVSNGDNVIKKLGVYVPTAGVYDFKIGQIDQNNLVVPSSAFQVTCIAGYNYFDLESFGYNVPVNNRVFMDISAINKLYNPNSTTLKTVPALIQDDAHVITGAYNGMVMHSTDYMIPFGYTLRTKSVTKSISDIKDDISTLSNRIEGNSVVETIISQPNGNKMALRADMSGNLVLGNYYPKKAVVLGNSLTISTGGIGMCASDQYHDYYYLVSQYLKSFRSDAQISRMWGLGWEGSLTSQARIDWWNSVKENFAADTDLVIIQLVDNVNTTEKQATFAQDSITLIEMVRTQCPKAKVLWVAGWFTDATRQSAVQAACAARGAVFVDISAYSNLAIYQGTMGMTRTGTDGSTWTVTQGGEAAHPGDLGFAKIADSIKTVLGFGA